MIASRRRATAHKKRLGLIVNPIAGMGGRVGLKGTDGPAVADRARRLGAVPQSPGRAFEALKVLAPLRGLIEVLSAPGEMGERVLEEAGFHPQVVGRAGRGSSEETTSADTEDAAREMSKLGVDLLVFAGGDGTARDVYRAVGRSVTCLGVPTGVKMHSAVFALNPRIAGDVALRFLSSPSRPDTSEGEVMDIDEDSFRKGKVTARLYGYLRIPREGLHLQSAKSGGARTEKQVVQGIATELFRSMEKGRLYIVGPGSTTRDILAELHLEKTLLGVDVVKDGKVVARDANESQLVNLLRSEQRSSIIVSPIGGQGYIFGRGNQQLSEEVIRRVGRENIIVVASKQKLASLEGRPLLVDTGDPDLDKSLEGFAKVITGFGEYVMCRVSG